MIAWLFSYKNFHEKRGCGCIPFFYGADERTRTADLILTKDALYLLSYTSTVMRGLFQRNLQESLRNSF